MESSPTPTAANPWPRRWLSAAALVLLPLFVFGGSVTTLGAGMAVQGWWNAEGHFMPLFPLAKWFRDLGTFVEHSHRQFGMLIGLLMIAAVVSTWRSDRRPSARALVAAALLAVCVQGWLGGSRVLENSPALAFLHGVFAQAVFALLAAVWLHQGSRWRAMVAVASPRARGLRALSIAACLAVFVQVALGAWYRHTLRTGLNGDAMPRLALHLVGAFVCFGLVMAWIVKLKASQATQEGPQAVAALRRTGSQLALLLGVQFALGFLAFGLQGSPASAGVGFLEWALATSHVVVGAMLLAQCVWGVMWCHRALVPSREEPSSFSPRDKSVFGLGDRPGVTP